MNLPAARPSWFVVAIAGATVVAFALPIAGLVARVEPAALIQQLASPELHAAMGLSLLSSVSAVLLAVLFGLPLAMWLASGRSLLHTTARIVVLLPIVLPPVVAGIALLLAFGSGGIVGRWMDAWFGSALPFTTAATIVAAAYVGMPFFVLSAEAGLRSFDRRHLAVAATLGAGPARRFFTVTMPMVWPSLRTGGLLCWARALGEFCATQMFAGNVAGTTRTMPLACGVAMEVDPGLAIAASVILAAVSVAVLFVLRHSVQGVR